MTIHATPFAIVPEWVLDADISDRAVRLYCVLRRYADRNDRCHPSRKTLADRLATSTDSLDRATKELVSLGALVVTHRANEDGQTSNDYWLASDRTTASTQPQGCGAPPPQGCGTNESQVEREKDSPSTGVDLRLVQCEVAQPFDPFWSAYPARNGKRLGKAKAAVKWDKLNQRERADAMVGVRNYAAACARGRLPKDAERWLRDRCWEEWQEGEADERATNVARAADSDANALARLIQERGF